MQGPQEGWLVPVHSLSMPWKGKSPVPFCISTSFSKVKVNLSSPAMTSSISFWVC